MFPDGGRESSSTNTGAYDSALYGPAGNVLRFRNRRGVHPLTYDWDVAGNLTSVGYPTVASPVINPGTLTATYAYDALNRMTGVTTTGIKAASATLTYDTLSRRKSVTFGDNGAQTYGADRLGRQISETTSNAASPAVQPGRASRRKTGRSLAGKAAGTW